MTHFVQRCTIRHRGARVKRTHARLGVLSAIQVCRYLPLGQRCRCHFDGSPLPPLRHSDRSPLRPSCHFDRSPLRPSCHFDWRPQAGTEKSTCDGGVCSVHRKRPIEPSQEQAQRRHRPRPQQKATRNRISLLRCAAVEMTRVGDSATVEMAELWSAPVEMPPDLLNKCTYEREVRPSAFPLRVDCVARRRPPDTAGGTGEKFFKKRLFAR